jgi:osmotically-inducible protein OsmY
MSKAGLWPLLTPLIILGALIALFFAENVLTAEIHGLAPGVRKAATKMPLAKAEAEDGITRQKVIQFFHDTWITTKVKSMLLISGKAKGADLNVTTSHGVVTVVGFVNNDRQKEELVQLIQEVAGVEAVRALLVVKTKLEKTYGRENGRRLTITWG